VFERYTERARRVLFYTRHEAGDMGSVTIGAEHLLLALVQEGQGLTSGLFERSGLSLDSLRQEIRARVPVREKIPQSMEIPFNADAKHVLRFAADEADRLKHSYIGTEHLLLGLLSNPGSLAGTILTEKGIDLGSVRQEIVRATGRDTTPAS
jgi:ATP-dependent Clp protease ATP-binding subunit ClpC